MNFRSPETQTTLAPYCWPRHGYLAQWDSYSTEICLRLHSLPLGRNIITVILPVIISVGLLVAVEIVVSVHHSLCVSNP